MNKYEQYETVVGLEVHAQLLTHSKIFAPDPNAFGAAPNTHVSHITLAHPGTLPVLNEKAVAYAVMMGLATDCQIQGYNQFARKNYFYPDLPKGYQISQDKTPICYGGQVVLKNHNGTTKTIRLTRIHLEEDAGKSSHDQHEAYSQIDLNRAGTPLIEIVSEPDLRSGEEAATYLGLVRQLVQYLGICDGNMEEGSLRCDANVSVRKHGDPKLGQRVEIKNMNSLRNVKRAIESEAKRQIDLIEQGERVLQQTRSYDADTNTTFALRTKENEDDYRYFPEPDLPPVVLTDAYIEQCRATMPELPQQRYTRYIEQTQLSPYDAQQLTDDLAAAQLFDQTAQLTKHAKAIANWLLGPIRNYLHEHQLTMAQCPLSAQCLAELVELVEAGKVSFSTAAQQLLPALAQQPNAKPQDLATQLQLLTHDDNDLTAQIIAQVLAQHPDKVKAYRHHGKKGLIGFFMGEVMRLSTVKLDPKTTNKMLSEALNN
ncbi:MAG: Asp-tRNA(Asn)/Glu-tRNA(Gln) amidotransferase subunit GatB [Chitinophagales bacterium]|nr:Asp-tRNA(Asn)/Glu-tRNA(Gln) amidotransferase subunit GatB [Chitinophagales bacterium]